MRAIFLCIVILASICGGFAIVDAEKDEGKILSDQYCASCHVKPLPEHLNKATWVAKVFPMMRQYMGMDPLPKREQLPHDLAAFFPSFPTMTEDEWYTVAQWYIDRAPVSLPEPPPIVISGITPQFVSTAIMRDVEMPMTTLVRLDAQRGRFVIGDGMGNAIHVTDRQGVAIASVQLSGPPSCVEIQPDAWYVTDMGMLLPHDSAIGKLVKVTWNRDTPTTTVILDSLRRPTHVIAIDLNGDKRRDFLVCEYGNLVGRFGWYEIDAFNKVKYHLLSPTPGAIRAVVRDVNGDKRPDIVVQMAQAREGLVAYINKGKGRYAAQELITFPPSYGSSSFAFVDVDGDGKEEIIVTTGDNGDYDNPPYKPYHGVYTFTSNGKGTFMQSQFQHLDGAYGAHIQDFDGDGNRDMLSFSYFPRFDRGDIDLVRYDSRYGKADVTSWRVQGAERGRWLVTDVGDVDGDGDQDILLGNVSIGPGIVPDTIARRWMGSRIDALYLRNSQK